MFYFLGVFNGEHSTLCNYPVLKLTYFKYSLMNVVIIRGHRNLSTATFDAHREVCVADRILPFHITVPYF